MSHTGLRRIARLSTAAAVLAIATTVCAQPTVSKQVRLILPFPPGGPTDMLGRAVAQKLSELVGQPVVADNRPGAGGNLGLELGARAPGDGHTLVLSSPLVAISPLLYKKLNYDPARDLAPIAQVAQIQNVLVVHPSVPARSLKELIEIARRSPGKLNFGSGGIGTTSHLAPALLLSMTGVSMTHVPYKGTGVALTAMLGGEIDMLIMAVPAAQAQIQAGRARALAVLADKRQATLPNVPTSAEAGLPNYEVPIWYGILTSASTPKEWVSRWSTDIKRALDSADLKDRLTTAGIEPHPTSPEQFAAFIKSEGTRYAKVIKDAGISPQ
jgi:tripartite-type tricarboxylate transporter receptor subunit TctC